MLKNVVVMSSLSNYVYIFLFHLKSPVFMIYFSCCSLFKPICFLTCTKLYSVLESAEDLESGETTYFPALHVGVDNSSSVVTTSIYNLIIGKLYCDHHGTMQISGNRQYSCNLKFKEQSILDRNPRQVHGFVEDVSGKKVASLRGKWDESMYYTKGDGSAKSKDFSDASMLWKRNETPPNLTRYNLMSFAITLNELTPGLQEILPPTDSRLRPDQRHQENGEYNKANSEKLRLETRQRMGGEGILPRI